MRTLPRYYVKRALRGRAYRYYVCDRTKPQAERMDDYVSYGGSKARKRALWLAADLNYRNSQEARRIDGSAGKGEVDNSRPDSHHNGQQMAQKQEDA